MFGWLRRHPRTRAVRVRPEGRRFVSLGGRRYLADAPYMLPKDLGEVSRLDFQHYMLRYALRGNYAAPVGSPGSILDVGCGTGRWPLELAAQFPAATVLGVDLEPPPPDSGTGPERRPENYAFVPGNVLEGLPFAEASFDFVHQRLLMGAIPAARWPDVVRELARVTRPGGWIELVEAAPAPGGGPAIATLNGWMLQATSRRGIDVYICRKLGDLLAGAGLGRVISRTYDLPMGRPAGRLGSMTAAHYVSLFQGLRGPILASGLVDAPTFDATLGRARGELDGGRTVSPYVVAYAQRIG